MIMKAFHRRVVDAYRVLKYKLPLGSLTPINKDYSKPKHIEPGIEFRTIFPSEVIPTREKYAETPHDYGLIDVYINLAEPPPPLC